MVSRPLFIYDVDGTLEESLLYIYALKQAKDPKFNLTLAEFNQQHPNEYKLMFDGMSDLVRYTASIGNNVLLSAMDPTVYASRELQSLFPLFQNWSYERQQGPFGTEPPNIYKDDPFVAKTLRETFRPSRVVVIGNSIAETNLAKNINADILFLRTQSDTLLNRAKSVPYRYKLDSAQEAIRLLHYHLNQPAPILMHQRRTQRI